MLKLTRHRTLRWKCSPITTAVFVTMEHFKTSESCAKCMVPSPHSAISSLLVFEDSETSVSFNSPHPRPQHEYKQNN